MERFRSGASLCDRGGSHGQGSEVYGWFWNKNYLGIHLGHTSGALDESIKF